MKTNLAQVKLDAIKIGLIVMLALFLVPLTTKATSDFTDDFDSYPLGDFYDNGVWQVATSGSVYIINSQYKSYPQSLEFFQSPQAHFVEKDLGVYLPSGNLKIYFKMDSPFSTTTNCAGGMVNAFSLFSLSLANSEMNSFIPRVDDQFGSITYATQSIPTAWIPFEVEWKEAAATGTDVRYKFNEGFWSEWRNLGSSQGFDRLNLKDVDYSYSDCYSMFFDSFISSSVYGLCGSGLDCIYCENQTDCENNSCYWIQLLVGYDIFECVPTQSLIQEQLGTELDPLPFYASNSSYATPTGLYIALTDVSGGIFQYLSSWLSHFSNLFDLTQATQKGTEFGQAIPKARGYLNLFNGIFGDLPIGEIFIIYLTVLIAVIIFRIVRHTKSLIPFQ